MPIAITDHVAAPCCLEVTAGFVAPTPATASLRGPPITLHGALIYSRTTTNEHGLFDKSNDQPMHQSMQRRNVDDLILSQIEFQATRGALQGLGCSKNSAGEPMGAL